MRNPRPQYGHMCKYYWQDVSIRINACSLCNKENIRVNLMLSEIAEDMFTSPISISRELELDLNSPAIPASGKRAQSKDQDNANNHDQYVFPGFSCLVCF